MKNQQKAVRVAKRSPTATSKLHPHGIRTGQYRSKNEAALAADLERRGVAFEYERLQLEYTTSQTYTPDFALSNGIVIEFKGWFKSEDRTKMKLVKAQHPELDIRMVFCSAKNKLGGGSKTTYAEWCDKHGFPWAEKTVPLEWTK